MKVSHKNETLHSSGRQTAFEHRHIPESASESRTQAMLSAVGYRSLDAFIADVVPEDIRLRGELKLPKPATEAEALTEFRETMDQNKVFRSFIGMGFYDCITPTVVQRNILENPGWYTAYTPYQAEIAQGRLEALLNFQTLVTELTGMEVANSSLLDEGSAAGEGFAMLYAARKGAANRFLISSGCHPQVIAVVKTRAATLPVTVEVGEITPAKITAECFGVLLAYPTTEGKVEDLQLLIDAAKKVGAGTVVTTDLMSLTLLKPPGEMGADIVVGNSQRFGVPLGFGGPHAAFFATKNDLVRNMPGRLVGVSKDREGRPAFRLALQTREQHIRREKATSNVCTAQVLLAVMASMYAVYHGPQGVKQIAGRIHRYTGVLAAGLRKLGFALPTHVFYDTLKIPTANQADILRLAQENRMNLRAFSDGSVGVTLDEVLTDRELLTLLKIFNKGHDVAFTVDSLASEIEDIIPASLKRTTPFLQDKVFNTYHSESEMLRYMRKLESKDLSLTHSMIPLGSCTMKLNATSELVPVTWPEVNRIHPFAPSDQTRGYQKMVSELETWLSEITGMSNSSLQPNSGAQGEYAGLLAIRKFHDGNNQKQRNICLIPKSAHGTNPASAVMAGFKVKVVECDEEGSIDLKDLKAKADEVGNALGALMVTYPSTHGVFETGIRQIVDIIHSHGGQVYMDGANMNAQVGLCRPGDYEVDVCHLNLHKTFCIPHGGGGPGVGPIAVRKHLAPFLPNHPVVKTGGTEAIGPVTSAPWGSASILPISWMYIRMMGASGLKAASQYAILNANYAAKRLKDSFPILYSGAKGLVAHECILDLRDLKKSSGIDVEDVAKRLMDYGFHAPTMSFPVPGTLMVEPTESESKAEIDRFCDAMIAIRKEIEDVATGKADKLNNVLKHAPHTAWTVMSDAWDRPYSRQLAAYPIGYLRENKFWPSVSRIDNVWGDRNLFCTCSFPEDLNA